MNSSGLFTTFTPYLPWVLGIGAMILFASDVISIILNPQYHPVDETISEIVHYPSGWIITIGMTAMVVMHTLLTAVLISSPASRCHRLVRFAGIIFAIVALGFVIIMVFRTDPGKEVITLGGGIHIGTAVGISILFPIACGSLAIALWHHRKSEILIIFSAIIAAVSLFVAWQAMPQNDVGYTGVYERLLVIINLSWLVMAGFRLPRLLSIC